jgi:hypothetical protein
LICENTGVNYFVFAARESGRDDITLIGHVIGGRFPDLRIFIEISLAAVQAGDWFGEEIPKMNSSFEPGRWGRIKNRYPALTEPTTG